MVELIMRKLVKTTDGESFDLHSQSSQADVDKIIALAIPLARENKTIKTALNQIVKNFSIEIKRSNPNSIFTVLQPGTVKSNLSKPFEKNVQPDQLFSPDYSAQRMLDVIDRLTPDDSGKFYAWNGDEIQP